MSKTIASFLPRFSGYNYLKAIVLPKHRFLSAYTTNEILTRLNIKIRLSIDLLDFSNYYLDFPNSSLVTFGPLSFQ
jgi:hypothetical protein